jgi:hypothetical protein
MAARYTKGVPDYVYFVGDNDSEWIQGPFVKPRPGCRKFKLTEVPMDTPTKGMVIDLTAQAKFIDLTPIEQRA